MLITALLIGLLALGPKLASAREDLVSRPDPQMLQVGFQEKLLSIDAKQEPWETVLEEIREKTGIRFHASVPLAGSVSLSIPPLPIRQALQRLFGPETDMIIRYGGDAGLPKEVWIFGRLRAAGRENHPHVGGKAEGGLGASGSDPSSAAGQAPEGADVAGEPLEAEGDTIGAKDAIDMLVEMAQDDDPAARVQGLSALADSGEADEGTVQSALDAALADRDASVRGYAVQALASRGGEEAMGHLWQALRDPDPYVRVMAVETVAPQDQGIALLQAALSDPDETVRSLARFRLQQGERE